MRRGVHIAVSLMAVLLLLKPFDCFSSGKFTKEAADCCKRGKCRPSTKDDCCKGTLPGGKVLATASKAHPDQLPIALLVRGDTAITVPLFLGVAPQQAQAPTGSPPNSRLNLPLLI
jgi:hypothetical protein